MEIIFKSKLYREEFLRYGLTFSVFLWALLASALALRNSEKTVLISVDKNNTRVITENFDPMFDQELQNFIKTFLEHQYTYNETSFSKNIGLAADLMSEDLWSKSKPKLIEIEEKLKAEPLTQSMTINSIDLVTENRAEASLAVSIKSRLIEKKLKLKVLLNFHNSKRSKRNPWGYEIGDVSEVVL